MHDPEGRGTRHTANENNQRNHKLKIPTEARNSARNVPNEGGGGQVAPGHNLVWLYIIFYTVQNLLTLVWTFGLFAHACADDRLLSSFRKILSPGEEHAAFNVIGVAQIL